MKFKLVSKTDSIFSEAFGMYYPLIYSTICLKVNDKDEAEDITQNIFISFFKKIETIKDHRKWLLGSIRYEILAYYREKKDETDIDEKLNDVTLTFVNGFRDTRIIIQEAIEELKNEKDRLIFDYVAVQNLTYPETAKNLGLNTSQIKYRYGIIIKVIIDHLNKKGIKNIEDLL